MVYLVSNASRGGAIKPLMLEATQPHVIADDVQSPHHLAENQDPAQTLPLIH